MRMNKTQKLCLAAFLSLLFVTITSLGRAQTKDIQLTLNINPYPSPYISDWENNPTSVGQATVQNNSDSPRQYTLFVQLIKSGDGLLVDAESPSRTLGGFTSTILNNTEFISFSTAEYRNTRIKNQAFRTGRLPEGTYTACAVVRDLSGANLSRQACQDFEIVYPEPPQLIFPGNETGITTEFPTFQWVPVTVPPDYDLTYTLKIVELLEGQTPLDGLEANIPHFEETTANNNLPYPIDALAFEDGKTYAWRVQALDQFGMAPSSNQGYSEIFTFSVPADTTGDEESDDEAVADAGTTSDRETPPGPCMDEVTISEPGGTATSGTFAEGDDLQIGKFVLTLSALTSETGTGLSGEGTVNVPFFNADIRVSFENLRVNDEGVVLSGEARAITDPAAGVSATAADRLANGTDLSREELTDLQQTASQTERLVSSFVADEPVSLPIGYDRAISGRQFVIGIYHMRFTSTTAMLHSGFQLELPELGPDMDLNFQQRANFHPNGLAENMYMYLAEDFGYERSGSWSMTFKAPVRPTPESAPSDSGTYALWDCDGFEEVRIKADVEFPRDWFTPDPDDGSTMAKASFVTRIRDGSGWMAEANMEPVKFSGAPGFGMEIENMVFDFSSGENPEGIVFSDTFEGITGSDWTGFYIQSANIILPSKIQTFEGSPPSPSVSNLLIDDSGFTANILVENLIRGETADFGGWAGSIEELGLNFVSSSLNNGFMNGGIKLPVSDDALDYEALLNVVHESEADEETDAGDLEYTFTVTPEDTYTVPMWAAELSLYETTYVSLESTSETDDFEVEATLNGTLGLAEEISGATSNIPLVGFSGIDFEGLRFMNRDPHYEIGTWSFASPQKGMGGFPVSIDSVRAVSKESDDGNPSLGLGFDLNINLMGETVSGTAGLAIYGKLNVTGPGPMTAEYDGIDLERIEIDAEIDGAVEIHGLIEFYDGDPTFGNGFRGVMEATFIEEVTIAATAQFGSVDEYRYWYVDAMANLGSTGVSMGVVSLYGFGGGAWYHMKRSGSGPDGAPAEFADASPDGSTEPGVTNSGYRFVPDRSVDLGVRALVTLGLSGSQAVFNADVELVVTIEDGTLGEMALAGDFFMLADVPNRGRAILNGGAELRYVHPEKKFTGDFDIQFDLTPINASIEMNLLFSPDEWYVKVGGPDKRMANVDMGFANMSINAYFMTGSNIPGIPDPPEFFGVSSYSVGEYEPERDSRIARGKGFAFGASASLGVDLDFLIFFASLHGSAGFDFSLIKEEDGCLNWREVGLDPGQPPGWSGWYGSGQVYAYIALKAGVRLKLIRTRKITLIKAELGALLRGEGPKPTHMMGMLKGKFTVLRVIKINFRFKAEIGNKCEMPDRHPLDELGMEIISDIEPFDNAEEVDVYAEPQVAFNLPVGDDVETIRVEDIDEESGDIDVRYFRAQLRDFTIHREDRAASLPVSRLAEADDGLSATLYPRDLLAGETEHEVEVEVYVEELIDGRWQTSRDPRTGEVYTQSKSVTFETGPYPDVIEDRNVAYTYPIKMQRFFLQEERGRGRVVLKRGFAEDAPNPLTVTSEKPNHQMIYAARFVPVGGGEPDRNEISYNSGNRTISFDIPNLDNEAIYSVQIVRMEIDTSGFSGPLAGSRAVADLAESVSVRDEVRTISNTLREELAGDITIERETQELPGTRVRSNEKLLHQFFFRTSRYDSFNEKMDDTQLANVEGGSIGMFQSNTLNFSAEEGFDEFDLQGISFERDGVRQRFGPLIQVTAKDRSTFWHGFFANFQVYDRIDWLQERSPLPPFQTCRKFWVDLYNDLGWGTPSNRFIRGYCRYAPGRWSWESQTRWERADRRNTLADYINEGQHALNEAEVRIAGASSAASLSSTTSGFSLAATGGGSGTFLGSGSSMGLGSSSYSLTASTFETSYPLEVLHRHGIVVPLDYQLLKRNAGIVLSRFTNYELRTATYRLSSGDKFRLQRIIRSDYVNISPEQYQITFTYYPYVSGTRSGQLFLENTAAGSRHHVNFQYQPE